MAKVVYSAGIDHMSGALSKPSKSGQHSCEKMLLATHRTAATTSKDCNRIYLRTPVKRTSPLSQREFENRAKFMVVSGMIKARKADLMKITTDQQNFLAQKNDPDGAKTMKAYYWKICGAEYDESHASAKAQNDSRHSRSYDLSPCSTLPHRVHSVSARWGPQKRCMVYSV